MEEPTGEGMPGPMETQPNTETSNPSVSIRHDPEHPRSFSQTPEPTIIPSDDRPRGNRGRLVPAERTAPTGSEPEKFQQAIRQAPDAQPKPSLGSQAISPETQRRHRRDTRLAGIILAVGGILSAFGIGSKIAQGDPTSSHSETPAATESGENLWIKLAGERYEGKLPLKPGEEFVEQIEIAMPGNEVLLDEHGKIRNDIDVTDYPSYYSANGMPDMKPVARVGLRTKIKNVLATKGGINPFTRKPERYYIARAVDANAKDMEGEPILDPEIFITIPSTFARSPLAEPPPTIPAP